MGYTTYQLVQDFFHQQYGLAKMSLTLLLKDLIAWVDNQKIP